MPAFFPAAADKAPSDSDYEAYSAEMIQQYISICSFEPKESFSISQPMPINNSSETTTRAVFLYDGDECIGIMLMAYVNDAFASSFIPGEFPQVSEASSTGEPMALYTTEYSLYLVSGTTWWVLTGRDELKELKVNKLEIDVFKEAKVQKTSVPYYEKAPGVKSSGIGNQLNVDLVGNDTSPDTGKAMCWAASLASVIRYRTNTHTLTAMGLYNQLKSSYPHLLYGYPIGTPTWEKRCFSLYSLSKTYVVGAPGFTTIKGIIDNNRPIYSSLSAFDANSNEVRHGIDTIGYGAAYGFYNYVLMDPNVTTGYVVVAGSSSGATPFVYVTSSFTYTQFNYYIY